MGGIITLPVYVGITDSLLNIRDITLAGNDTSGEVNLEWFELSEGITFVVTTCYKVIRNDAQCTYDVV